MAELPWFPLYARDWLAGEGTSMMLPEQEGPFIRLLCIAWGDGTAEPSLPDDDAALATMTRLGARWKKFGGLIRAQFESREGRLFNAKLSHVWREQRARSAKLAENGRKGGRAKAGLRPGHDSASSPEVATTCHTEAEAETEEPSLHSAEAEATAELEALLAGVPSAREALTGFLEGLPTSTRRFGWTRNLITSLKPMTGGKPITPGALVAAMRDFALADRRAFPYTGVVFRAFADRAMRDLTAVAAPRITAVPRSEHWTDKKAREEQEEGERQMARARSGNVDQRRGQPDGSAWYSRMQREAKALGKHPTLYAYDHMHEAAEAVAHA